ncbi:hypothetical protein IID24_03785 [Patescibacteria group bacterium]|nr:hypothetical protein [Patescibacteria group bacterium]
MQTVPTLQQVPLQHVVLAILSLAAERGQTRMAFVDFFRAFADLKDEFGDTLPPMVFTRTVGSAAYSKRLDDALGSIGSSIDLRLPRHLELRQDIAHRHLRWLREKYGQERIDNLQPIVKRFIECLTPRENVVVQ